MSVRQTMTWLTADPEAVRRRLHAVGLVPDGDGLAAAGARIRVALASGAERLELPEPGDLLGPAASPPAGTSRPTASRAGAGAGPRLLAVGVATVELDRVAIRSGHPPERLADDTLLGARVGRLAPGLVLLLEPATEGRLAAALARHGEGPVALYLGIAAADEAAAVARLRRLGAAVVRGPGPFGPQLLVRGGPPAGPHLLLVPEGAADPRGREAPHAAPRAGGLPSTHDDDRGRPHLP